MNGCEWWRGAVIYQIYPRSFADSNGDGIGDLAGIIGKLDYLAGLGVDAVWLSPIFASPMKDFGYDVADYRAVDPVFGSVDDVRILVSEAHARNIRVLLDFVPSHTSDQHPWFRMSRESRDNFYTDWYVWSDPSIDGTPPNNWLSVFGGPAWTWEPRRQQYYFRTFLAEQPALNYRAPGLLAAILDEMRFWLELGVDGFRLDAINACVCDAELRDNPPAGEPFDPGDSVDNVNPFAMQAHVYSQTRPEITKLLERFRALMDDYPETTTIGEVASDDSIATAAEYLRGLRLHMAYTFNLLRGEPTATRVRDVVGRMEAAISDGWPCWSLSNHDVVRAATRWGGPEAPASVAKVVNAMLLSLRGTICLYQGEELGLPEADVPYERLQDPAGRPFWPEYKGRDGCRTPMPWSSSGIFAEFSAAEPWLPIGEEHRRRAVDIQVAHPGSTLNATRRFLAWRKKHPALVEGGLEFVDASKEVLVFIRTSNAETMICVFNPTGEDAAVPLPCGTSWTPLDGHGFRGGSVADGVLSLPPASAWFGSPDD